MVCKMWERGRWKRCWQAGEHLPQLLGKHVGNFLACSTRTTFTSCCACVATSLPQHHSRHRSLARVAIAIAIIHPRYTTLLSLIPTMVSGTPESAKSIKHVLRCINPDPQPLGSSGSASPDDYSPTRRRARWSWTPSVMTEEDRRRLPILKRKGKRKSKSKSKKRKPQGDGPDCAPKKRPWYRRL
jgi:hypothetical protein